MVDSVIEPAQVVPPTTPVSQPEAVVNPPASSDDTPVANPETPTTSEPASDPANANGTEEPDKGRSRAKDRIEDLVAEKNAAKEYAEYWREKALEIMNQGRNANTEPAPSQPEQIPDTPPTLEDVNFDQRKWSQELAKWNKVQVERQVAIRLEQDRAQAAQAAVSNQFQERVEAFKKDHPDFDTVLSNPRLPQLDRISAAMIVGSEHGADISYTLAKNPDLAVKISRMSASQQALAIGRLESDLARAKEAAKAPPPPASAPKAKAPAAVTNAPEPPTPVPAGGAPAPEPGAMDIKEWMKFRVQEARDRRRR